MDRPKFELGPFSTRLFYVMNTEGHPGWEPHQMAIYEASVLQAPIHAASSPPMAKMAVSIGLLPA